MNEIIEIKDDLEIHITSEICDTTIDYKFEFEDMITKQTGSIVISVKDGVYGDIMSNCEIIEDIYNKCCTSLEDFWQQYTNISKIKDKEEVEYLLPYAIFEFRNFQRRALKYSQENKTQIN